MTRFAPSPRPAAELPTQRRVSEGGAADATPPASAAGKWQLRLDGQEITVGRLVLFGRNPQREAGEEDAEVVKVRDEVRTVSKTHLAVGVDEHGVFAVDRGSTNGSAVTSPDGRYQLLRAGEPARIDRGWVVSFGTHALTVGRAD